ncbi:Metallo-dependent phosphatase-like protein [Tuber indicum]|nr:Metallo-dependent phosphatase-like protein [Tuber indicum]
MGIMRTLQLLILLLPLAAAIQPSAQDPVPGQRFRHLKWGSINFLHTTDKLGINSHGWHAGHLQEPQYSADFGDYLSFTSHLRNIAEENGVDLVVLDTGDRAEGNGLWDATDPMGKYTRNFYRELPLDILTLGNHELYNGTTAQNEFLEMVSYYEPFAARSRKFVTERQGFRIISFGFLFNFTRNYKNTRVKTAADTIKESWFQEVIHDIDVDLFVIIGHVDIHSIEFTQIFEAIREVHPNIPIQFFGGHSHIRNFRILDNKSTALESGKYFETVGWLSIDGIKAREAPDSTDNTSMVVSRRYIDVNRAGYQHHSGKNATTFDTPQGLLMTERLAKYRAGLGLDRLIGCAPQDFSLSKHIYPGPQNWYSYLEEHILPAMVYNKERSQVPRFIFINTGSQRSDVFKGPFTYDSSFLISPFTSKFIYAKDIDYSIAIHLRDFFENDAGPYKSSDKSENPLENRQQDTAEVDIQSSPLVNHDQAPLTHSQPRHKYSRVIGYATIDDAGTDGDDTIHIPLKRYPTPNVIQGNASFPEDWESYPPAKIDIVFFDFIAWHVAAGLNEITGTEDYSTNDFLPYMRQEDTMTKLLLDYVAKYWGRDC